MNSLIEKITYLQKNVEILFIAIVFSFSILMRILPYALVSVIFVTFFIALVMYYFYNYILKIQSIENNTQKVEEFSWGFTKEDVKNFDLKSILNYLKDKDIIFYKNFLHELRHEIILFVFMFGDFIVSFKNLSLSESGVYFALSLFCKFIFISYIYINRSIVAVSDKDENKEEKVLDIFYKNLNGMLSLGFVIFVLFFILSKYLIEIFFGESYVYYQTSLPFIMVANIALLVALLTYETAKKIDKDGTKKVLKIFVPIFTILFIFMTNGYVDTVAYFVIGGCSILSIFLYNFVIKRPSYIQSTYNYLF